MSFVRSTVLRAATVARSAPWQRALQRRTYASAHGHAEKKSELPWLATSVVGTGAGLYFIFNQDLGHGEGHGEHHDEHHEEKLTTQPEEAQAPKSEEDKPDLEPKEDDKKAGGAKVDKQEISEKAAPSDAKEEDLEGEKNAAKKADTEEGLAKQKDEAPVHATDDDKSSPPDEADKPAPRKVPGDFSDTSGKQKGLSNDDTKHTADIHDDPEKSKKGEGVAETSKLQGTVSTDRPQAENKEERGKAQQDKDE